MVKIPLTATVASPNIDEIRRRPFTALKQLSGHGGHRHPLGSSAS
jgi:hypothetical protein